MTADRDEYDALAAAWVEGRATPADAARLGAVVAADPAARDRLLALADLHACLSTDDRLWAAPPAARPPARPRRVPSALAFAAGLLLGVLPLAFALARTDPPTAGPLPLADGDFEEGVVPGTAGLPARTGAWGGDAAAIVTGPTEGVAPYRGHRMLRFLRSDFDGERFTRSGTGEVFQVVDLRGWPRPPGPVAVEVGGRVNAVAAGPGEVYRWTAHAFAFDADPTARGGEPDHHWLYRECLAAAHRPGVPDDGDPAAWQRVAVALLVPPAADYLVASFGVQRTRPAPTADPVRFPGHFLDAVEVAPTLPPPPRR